MANSDGKPGTLEIAVYAVAAICFLYFGWKSFIDGYYPREATVVIGTGLAGAALALFGSRLTTQRKKAAAEAADRAKGVE